MSKPVWGSPIYPNSIKEHPGSCINAWRGRIYRVTRPMHKHRDLWPFLSRLNPVWEKCGRGNGIKFLRGGAGLGKTLPMGPRTKSDLEWRRPEDEQKDENNFFGYHPRGCKSRVEDPCGHDGRGLHWGPRFAASPPTRFFIFVLLLQLVYVPHSVCSKIGIWF